MSDLLTFLNHCSKKDFLYTVLPFYLEQRDQATVKHVLGEVSTNLVRHALIKKAAQLDLTPLEKAEAESALAKDWQTDKTKCPSTLPSVDTSGKQQTADAKDSGAANGSARKSQEETESEVSSEKSLTVDSGNATKANQQRPHSPKPNVEVDQSKIPQDSGAVYGNDDKTKSATDSGTAVIVDNGKCPKQKRPRPLSPVSPKIVPTPVFSKLARTTRVHNHASNWIQESVRTPTQKFVDNESAEKKMHTAYVRGSEDETALVETPPQSGLDVLARSLGNATSLESNSVNEGSVDPTTRNIGGSESIEPKNIAQKRGVVETPRRRISNAFANTNDDSLSSATLDDFYHGNASNQGSSGYCASPNENANDLCTLLAGSGVVSEIESQSDQTTLQCDVSDSLTGFSQENEEVMEAPKIQRDDNTLQANYENTSGMRPGGCSFDDTDKCGTDETTMLSTKNQKYQFDSTVLPGQGIKRNRRTTKLTKFPDEPKVKKTRIPRNHKKVYSAVYGSDDSDDIETHLGSSKNLIVQEVQTTSKCAPSPKISVKKKSKKKKCVLCKPPKMYEKLSRHKRAMHEGVRYHCPNDGCSKSFSQRNNLNNHIKMFCGKGAECDEESCEVKTKFDTRSALIRHKAKEHGKTLTGAPTKQKFPNVGKKKKLLETANGSDTEKSDG